MVFVGCWSYTLSLVTLITINYTTFNVITLTGAEAFESKKKNHVLMSKIVLMNITSHSKKIIRHYNQCF
jgi:hypothetical protein